MKVFRVVTEYDGETTKCGGERSTEIKQREYRYAAETIQEVWVKMKILNEEEETLVVIHEEHPAIIIL